jgi:hypothetical protein
MSLCKLDARLVVYDLGPDGTMIPHIKISRLPIPLGLSATVVCNLYCLDRHPRNTLESSHFLFRSIKVLSMRLTRAEPASMRKRRSDVGLGPPLCARSNSLDADVECRCRSSLLLLPCAGGRTPPPLLVKLILTASCCRSPSSARRRPGSSSVKRACPAAPLSSPRHASVLRGRYEKKREYSSFHARRGRPPIDARPHADAATMP